MSAAEHVARLDASLARSGETVTIRRETRGPGTPPAMIPFDIDEVPAFVTIETATDLAGSITQQQLKVITSPTAFDRRQFPLPLQAKDKVYARGKWRSIEGEPTHIHVGASIARIEIRLQG